MGVQWAVQSSGWEQEKSVDPALRREGGDLEVATDMTARNISDRYENISREASTTRGQHLHGWALTDTCAHTPHWDTLGDKDTDTKTHRNPGRRQNSLTDTRGRSPQVPYESRRSNSKHSDTYSHTHTHTHMHTLTHAAHTHNSLTYAYTRTHIHAHTQFQTLEKTVDNIIQP